MNTFSKRIGHLFAFIAVFAIAAAVVMLLWNWLIPAIFGWTCVTYWQAAGLMILGRLLIGGFGRFHHGGHGHFRHGRNCHDKFHKRMHREMMDMSDDERREFIRGRMKDFGHPFGREESCSGKNEEE